MKKILKELLICPFCLPEEIPLKLKVNREETEDVIAGSLNCKRCGKNYIIDDGIALLIPDTNLSLYKNTKYENPRVLSSYLWSHYGDWLNDKEWLPAYPEWVKLMEKSNGISLDIGCAVGRFTLEMTEKSDFSIGFDLSISFIKTARELMKKGIITFELTEEGIITSTVEIKLPEHIKQYNLDFIVADALNIPFPKGIFTKVASLNVLDKVNYPMRHLNEMNRVSALSGTQILISDPFSWSEEVADINDWLGGKTEGELMGFGHENVAKILEGYRNYLNPPWKVTDKGTVNWKIRNHRNHSELIKSLYVKAIR
jgi:ubiquinone/menaquinone biosynthesis C-methylase UbiE/uncharacterized protein YbaR (Trm112 family)